MATNALPQSDPDRDAEACGHKPPASVHTTHGVRVIPNERRSHGRGEREPSWEQPPSHARLHRKMTHEHGRALETLGHAIDYLVDSSLYQGPDSDILDLHGTSMEVLGILIAAQQDLMRSIPLTESFTSRLLNRLRGRE